MKQKTHITITIDSEVYLFTKLKEEFNTSKACNEYLKSLMGKENNKEELEKKLEEQMNKTTIIKHELKKVMIEASEKAAKELNEEQTKRKNELLSIPVGYSFEARIAREKAFKENPKLEKEWNEMRTNGLLN